MGSVVDNMVAAWSHQIVNEGLVDANMVDHGSRVVVVDNHSRGLCVMDNNMRNSWFMNDMNFRFMNDMNFRGNDVFVDDDVVLCVRLPVFNIFRLSVSNRDLGLLGSVPCVS